MATLNFQKNNNSYIAEVEVASDFNLHIERDTAGYLILQVRTSPTGKFDSVGGFNASEYDQVIDYDFSALVYPKTIRIVSKVEPTMAEITFAE